MLTGRRAFDGEDITEVLGAVVRLEPHWDDLSPEVPQPVRTLLQSCLVKDRRHRVTDISTALFVLEKAGSLAPPTVLDAAVSQQQANAAVADVRRALARSTRRRVALVGAAAFLMGLVIAAVVAWQLTRPAPLSVVRMTMITSGSTALTVSGTDRDVAITPDGSRIVYRGNGQLLVRALDQLEPTVLTGLGAPQGIFVSPDGQWIGYFDGTTIKKVAITGGSPVTIASVVGSVSRGATWGPDGTIVFATATAATALMRVSAAGGRPTVLTKADRARGESDHVWPEFLPGGEAVLYTITPVRASIENSQIAVLDLRTGTSTVLIPGGSDAHYVPTGHLVYGFAGTLRAVAFDLQRLKVVGTPTPVLEGVMTTAEGAANVAIGANGALVYISGVAGGGANRTVMSVDRQGRASPLPGLAPSAYRDVRVSADGAWLALTKEADVWTYNMARATLSRLTTDAGADGSALWTPDGQRIVFSSSRAGYPEIFWRAADGTGGEERLLTRAKDSLDLRASGWSADGKQLLFTEVPSNIQNAIGQLAIERPSDVRMLWENSFNNDFPAVSPDGRWIAYHSNLSGRVEIYVERYPQLGNRQLISTGGGRLPLWSRDGKELFFSSLDSRQMYGVAVQSGTTFGAGRPQVLFESGMLRQTAGTRPYDIAPDGRFVIIYSGQTEAAGDTASGMILVQNWFEELKRLVPTN
jgi:serine/threonine-protein kinase